MRVLMGIDVREPHAGAGDAIDLRAELGADFDAAEGDGFDQGADGGRQGDAGSRTELPPASTKWTPRSSVGVARARAMASSKAAPLAMMVVEVRMP